MVSPDRAEGGGWQREWAGQISNMDDGLAGQGTARVWRSAGAVTRIIPCARGKYAYYATKSNRSWPGPDRRELPVWLSKTVVFSGSWRLSSAILHTWL